MYDAQVDSIEAAEMDGELIAKVRKAMPIKSHHRLAGSVLPKPFRMIKIPYVAAGDLAPERDDACAQ